MTRIVALLALAVLLGGCFVDALNLVSDTVLVHPETSHRARCQGGSMQTDAVESRVKQWESKGCQRLPTPLPSNRF
jgi:hypothetical protein